MTPKQVHEIRLLACKQAQLHYDEWQQDEDGYDDYLGYGGICDIIAESTHTCLLELGHDAEILSDDDPAHAFCVVIEECGITIVDIPYQYYEENYGVWKWKKLPDVVFEPYMVYVYDMDDETYKQYIE